MEFLKEIALPQPIEHFHLLMFVLNLILILFLPYLGFLIGSTVLAVRARARADQEWGTDAARAAGRLLTTAMPGGSAPVFFAVLPSLALVFILAQLLQRTPSIAAGLMVAGFLVLVAGLILLAVFRHSIKLLAVLPEREAREMAALRSRTSATALRTGRWALTLLVVSSALCLGAISVAVNRSSWSAVTTVFDLLINGDFWVRYLHFAAVAVGATGIGFLFFFQEGKEGAPGGDVSYIEGLRSLAYRLAAFSLVVQPALMLLSIALLPAASLTGLVFALSGAYLIFLLLTAVFVYAYRKDQRPGYASYALYAMGIALFLVFTKDQIAISNATKDHAASLAVAAERELDVLKASLGVAPPAMRGEDIYNAKCSACHLFDAKKVGPPYKDVLLKYAGKKADLIRFVLNPVKVDPAYPSMPNQGLKPAEGDSIATYLLAKAIGVNAK